MANTIDEVQTTVIIIGAVLACLIAIAIIFGIVITVFVLRILKKLSEISLTVKTTRLDARKTLETVESSIVKNLMSTFDIDDNLEGTVPASPIFTTSRIFQQSPVSFKHSSALRADDYDHRKERRQGPPVPPKRAHSFYDGAYY